MNKKFEGGLQMHHVTSFCAALKSAWLKEMIDCVGV